MNHKVNLYLEKILKFFILVFFVTFIFYFLKIEAGSGDEQLFLDDLSFIKTNGWIQAISKKIALPYLILVYPFSLFFKDFVALRLVNVLLFVILFIYFKKIGEIKSKMFNYYFLFFSASGWFMSGTNDTLFIVALVVFFNEVYKFLENKDKTSKTLLLISLLLAFFTRELIYVYIPVLFYSLFLLYQKKINIFSNVKVPVVLFCFFIVINIPSLLANHSFSYDNKIPPITVKSNWAQRQYLAQLMVNNGALDNHQHPTWVQTDEYLIKNGKNSLPKGLISGMIFDLKLTFIEFFKDFTDVIFQSIRQTGFIILIVLSFMFYSFFLKKRNENLYVPIISFAMISIFSLIIISYVETRWLIPVFIMALIYYSDIEVKNKLHKTISILNNLCLILIIFYGIFRVYSKLLNIE